MAPTSPRARHRVHGFQSLGAPSLFVHLLFNDRPILRLFVPRRCSSRRKKSPWTRGRKMPVKYGRRYYCRIMPVCPGDSSIVDRRSNYLCRESRRSRAHCSHTEPTRFVRCYRVARLSVFLSMPRFIFVDDHGRRGKRTIFPSNVVSTIR